MITALLIGAGQRGAYCYGPYALQRPQELKFVAVAEPVAERRRRFAADHGIGPEMGFATWREALDGPRLADVVLICTNDPMHYEPAARAMEMGYDVLLEKPISNDPTECVRLDRKAAETGRLLTICHVLRYTSFFQELKRRIDSGDVGGLMCIQHIEEVGYWHQAHSFVRGNWRSSRETSPMILSKCCHDMDILNYLVGRDCREVSSFGSLRHFRPENRPQGAPDRCIDGCPHSDGCPYDATRLYLGEQTGWPTAAIADNLSMESRVEALRTGPYGRCVYACDNDVVDNQVVNLLYDGGVTVSMAMCAFTTRVRRVINIMGTHGQITGDMEAGTIRSEQFATGIASTVTVPAGGGHGGGDFGLLRDFLRAVQGGERAATLSSSSVSVRSHMMAFAAEQSRLTGRVVDIDRFMESL